MRFLTTLITALLVTNAHDALSNTFKTEKWKTNNGVQVVFYQAMEVPMLDISMTFAAGSAYDGAHYGLSSLTTHLLNQGNAGKDATAIAEAFADTGAQFDAASSKDMAVLNLRTLTSQDALNRSINNFAQIISHPDFPNDAFIQQKKQVLMSIEQVKESPDEIAGLNFFKTLYHNHPYAHPTMGTTDTINSITKKQVIDFYKQYFVANNALLVMVGAVDSQKAHELAEQLTRDLPKGTSASMIPKASPLSNAEKITIPFPSSQTVLRLGQLGIDHHSPAYFPLMVGNYTLGGGALVSRLAIEVREKRGLTYGVASQFVPMPGDGPFLISLSTQTNQANQALDITQNTLNTFIKGGPNSQELESAKKYLTGSFPLSLAGNRNIANLLVRMNFYHLPDNFLDTYVESVNKVTAEDIKMAFKQQVDPNKLLLVTVGQS